MEEVKTMEVPETSVEVSSLKDDMEKFLVEFNELQAKYNLTARPVITMYGPDIRIERVEPVKANEVE